MEIMVSSRLRASRGVLACSVVSEPSWPVFMAWSMSMASAPRHSPMMIRSGRIRRALISSSRWATSPWPSMLAGRVSSRTTWGCLSWSSAESSMVTMRSVGRDERGEDVEQRRLAGAGAARDQHVEPGLHDRLAAASSIWLGEALGPEQVLARQRIALELTDREMGPVERQRLDDRVDPGAVGQAGVHHGRGVVDPAARPPRRSGR